MEKGVIFADLEQFVIVPERPRLWDLKNPGWSVNKSKQNRFVITPNGYGLSIFTTLPLLTFGTILTLIGILFILLSHLKVAPPYFGKSKTLLRKLRMR